MAEVRLNTPGKSKSLFMGEKQECEEFIQKYARELGIPVLDGWTKFDLGGGAMMVVRENIKKPSRITIGAYLPWKRRGPKRNKGVLAARARVTAS